MKLNHVNLTVTDVRAASAFLETYVGLEHGGGNAGMAFMREDDGMVVTLMKAGRNVSAAYPETIHIGFFVQGVGMVDRVYARLVVDGCDVAPPERNNHAYDFYVRAPGGFTVELGA